MPQPNTSQKSKEKFFTPGLDKFGLIEAQAFRPGNHTHNEIALKGRPNRAGWQRRGMLSLVITPARRPPFQGESPRYGLPGLKAWAVLFSPFRRFDTHKKMAKLQTQG